MSMLRRLLAFSLLLTLFTLFSHRSTELAAQQKVASPVVVPPQAPTLGPVLPLGIQRGTSLELVLAGTNLADPVSLWTSFPAQVSFPADNNNGKDAAKLRVKLEVAPETPIGVGQLRLTTKQGGSNLRVFCVDDLPPVNEVETNKSKEQAQEIPFPCVVTGKIDNESSDFYRVKVREGQRVSVEVVGRRLGSQLDPVVFIRDASTGREIGGLYSDDAPGMQTDARLTHVFKAGGDYLIEIRDTLHRGGAEFYYRLRVGDFPLAIAPMPVALKRGSKANVSFAGPSVEGVSPVEVAAPADPTVNAVQVAPKRAEGTSGWPVSLLLSDYEQVLEQEPNNDAAKAMKLNVPCGVSARFLEKNDLDFYTFTAKKDQRYVITADTYEIGSPCEVYLILKNAKGADVAKSNPQQTTARIEYTADADGDFTLIAEHLNYAHGPNEVYHLTVRTAEPDIDVVVALDRFAAAPGGGGLIPVVSAVKRDYSGPIELSVVGHPGISGSVTIPANAPPTPQGQLLAFLPFQVKDDVAVGTYEVRVQAKGTVNGKDFVRVANATDVVKANLNGLVFPPKNFLNALAVSVSDKPVFAVTLKNPNPEGVRGVPLNLAVTAKREKEATEDIALSIVGQPPTVTAAPKNVPKGKDEGTLTLTLAPNAPLGKYPVAVRAASKVQGKDFAYYMTPVELQIVLPVEVKPDPSPFRIKPGEKKKLKATAIRKGGYDGPIDVEVKNLPANVTAPKVTIPKDKTEAEIEVSAANNAAAGEKNDVNLVATATGAANQQATSPNLVVRIEKTEPKEQPELLPAPKERELLPAPKEKKEKDKKN